MMMPIGMYDLCIEEIVDKDYLFFIVFEIRRHRIIFKFRFDL